MLLSTLSCLRVFSGWTTHWGFPFLIALLLMLAAAGPGYAQFPTGFSGGVAAYCPGGAATATEYGLENVTETSPSVLLINFTASPSLLSNIQVVVLLDGSLLSTSASLSPGQSMTPVTTGVLTGNHQITIYPASPAAGCSPSTVYVLGTATIVPQAATVPVLSPVALLLLAISLVLCGTRTIWKQIKGFFSRRP